MKFAYTDTPCGLCRIGYEGERLCSLRIVPTADTPDEPSAISENAAAQLGAYFAGTRHSFDLPLSLCGTPFQRAVWEALLTIPYGETRSYGEIARAVGRPRAARAVGMAVHNNPLWIVVPCHRVIGADGSLTGYEGGLEMKQTLLTLEQCHDPAKNSIGSTDPNPI